MDNENMEHIQNEILDICKEKQNLHKSITPYQKSNFLKKTETQNGQNAETTWPWGTQP